jgi:predicted RNase H-like HicB family nuclease
MDSGMLTYKAGYKIESDGVHAEVLDFPSAISCGTDLNDARTMLADALMLMADTYLMEGDQLPRPNPDAVDPEMEMDIIEPIYLYLTLTRNIDDVPPDYREFKKYPTETLE